MESQKILPDIFVILADNPFENWPISCLPNFYDSFVYRFFLDQIDIESKRN